MRQHNLFTISSLAALLLLGGAVAQAREPARSGAKQKALAAWRAKRFGMFIHWGPVSLKGTEIGWSRGRQVPEEEYDQLYKKFNPTRFDAGTWVSIAKAAGMKYLVITSKHHDGFCIWDSKYTDYDIMATPFRRDILRELSDACRKQGITFCTYHSICDWRHPDYPTASPGGRGRKPHPNMPRYVEYLKNQTREIIEKYGPIGIMWFDGEWEKPWTPEYGDALYDYLMKLQPDLIINNRVGKGRHGMAGTTRQSSHNPGDYDTPEQRVGGFQRARPWETCMTICRQWAWKPNDKLKSLAECLRILIQTIGGDGNLLLNVGPMPDGRIEPRQVKRLEEIGAWLKKYGDCVYGTRGGPFKPGPWGASTCKGRAITLFILKPPPGGVLSLPRVPVKILSAKTLSAGDAKVTQSAGGITVDLSGADRAEAAVVIQMATDGDTFRITPVAVSSK